MSRSNRNKIHSWSFVIIQAIILVLIVFINSSIGPKITPLPVLGNSLQMIGWFGIILSAYNIRGVLTAEPLPKENGKLTTDGLYKYVRHPMYTSVILLVTGISISSGSLIKYALVIGLTLLFHFKTNYEERYLSKQYPEYKEYSKKTSKFIPFIKK